MSIFRELQRRNVLRVAAGYIAVSWLIVQIMDTLSEAFGFTGEHLRIAIIVLAVCFIPAMIISWAFELTPQGIKRDSEVEHDAPAAKKSAKRLDRFVMAALVDRRDLYSVSLPSDKRKRDPVEATTKLVELLSDPERLSDGIVPDRRGRS